jgi:hypothetical protein
VVAPAVFVHIVVVATPPVSARGAPANLSSAQWTEAEHNAAARRGTHKGTSEHIEFMQTEFHDMVLASQWLVLPYRLVHHLPNLPLSPTGVVPQRDRHQCPIVDYTFSDVNEVTVSQAPDSIQFGVALLRFLQRLERADTRRAPSSWQRPISRTLS